MLLAIPLILNGIIQTETRGAVVGLFFAGVVTAFLKPKKYRTVYYLLVAIGLVGFIALANNAFIDRIKTLQFVVNTEQELDNSSKIRVELVKAQARMFKDHPLGAGHQGSATLSRAYLEEGLLAVNTGSRASHNTVMTVLVDQGILGILIVSVLCAAVISSLRRLKAMDRKNLSNRLGLYGTMLGGALASILAAGMFAQYIKAEVLIWCIGLLVILNRLAAEDVKRSGESTESP